MDDENTQNPSETKSLKEADFLSFKVLGRPMPLDRVADEFQLMKGFLKKDLTAEIARRICTKSGSHLIKLVSPRADGDHAMLRFDSPESNKKSSILPSVNAPDIPFCKVVFRPLEVIGHPTMTVVDHILNPDDHSVSVLAGFSDVFGDDVLTALRQVLGSPSATPLKLGAGEFPIIFIPRPGGGDLQITPVSPATTFMGMKRVTDHYFQKTLPDGPRPPRGRWTKQAVSSKPQNISGAIGGPRVRFLATMPPAMHKAEAELYRFVHGGGFPRWRDDEVSVWVLRYADMLDADTKYNNEATRAALDRTADRLIRDAAAFIEEMFEDAKNLADAHDISHKALTMRPTVPQVLFRRHWGKDTDFDRARKALTSPHFDDRIRKNRAAREDRT